jgi:hypothetical protein
VVSIVQARCALRATNAPSAGLIHIGAIRALATSTKHGSKRDEEEYIKILDALKKTSLDRMDTPNKYQVSIGFFAFARETHRKRRPSPCSRCTLSLRRLTRTLRLPFMRLTGWTPKTLTPREPASIIGTRATTADCMRSQRYGIARAIPI